MKKTYELSSLLNLFLNRRVWTRDFTLRQVWVEDERVTKLCTLLYGYKFSERDKYADFREIKDYKPMPSINPSDYLHPSNSFYIDISGELNVPSNLNELLDKVFRLRKDKRKKLLNVAKLFSIASKLWDASETAAYLATVNTIESIVAPSRSKERCETCNKLLEGPTKSFEKFMEKNTSTYNDEFIERVKNKIYKTRSNITHGGILLGEDRNPYWYDPSAYRHKVEGHILRCLVREAIINWFTDVTRKIQ
jgi:hypothetical protein